MINEKIAQTVRLVMEVFRDAIKKEGEDQGHRDTGKMLDTLEIKVDQESGQVVGKLTAQGYSVFVQTGVSAGKIRTPISVLVSWWKRKGLGEVEATRAAWATKAKQKKEGMPTKNALAFSKTGQRIGFVSEGIKKALIEARALFEKEFETVVEFEISEYFRGNLQPLFDIEL